MADGDRQLVGGWVVREDWRLAWNQGASDPELKMAVCGEIGHTRWLLILVAFREVMRRELDTKLAEFAQRVGVEYTPTQRREAPNRTETGRNP